MLRRRNHNHQHKTMDITKKQLLIASSITIVGMAILLSIVYKPQPVEPPKPVINNVFWINGFGSMKLQDGKRYRLDLGFQDSGAVVWKANEPITE